MKKWFLSISILFIATLTFAQHDMKDMPGMKMPMEKKVVKKPIAKTQNINPSEKIIYTCVMHPEVQKDKPGNCPKCGMKLVKKIIKFNTSITATAKPDRMDTPMKDTSEKMDMGNMKYKSACNIYMCNAS